MERIRIMGVKVEAEQISCQVDVEGTVREAFSKPCFEFRYISNTPLTGVPPSIAVIPLLADVLPVAWIYDAVIEVEACDRDFYESIPRFKQGYIDMYPMLTFGGRLEAARLIDNPRPGDGSLCFFSSGVDSYDTLLRHADEKPTLLTLWGSDVRLRDAEGWQTAKAQMRAAVEYLGSEGVAVECRSSAKCTAPTPKRACIRASGGCGTWTLANPASYSCGSTAS